MLSEAPLRDGRRDFTDFYFSKCEAGRAPLNRNCRLLYARGHPGEVITDVTGKETGFVCDKIVLFLSGSWW